MYLRIYWKVLGWSLLMLVLFLAPAGQLPESPEIPLFDKGVHIFMFSVFSVFLFIARMTHRKIKLLNRNLMVYVFLSVLLFGMLIEISQSLLDLGRNGEILDLLADLAGFFIGLLFILVLQKNLKFPTTD